MLIIARTDPVLTLTTGIRGYFSQNDYIYIYRFSCCSVFCET